MDLIFFDAFIFIPFIIGAYRGFNRGALIQLFSLLALLIGIFISTTIISIFYFNYKLEAFLFIILLSVMSFLSHVLGRFLQKYKSINFENLPSHFIGAFFGITKYAFILSGYFVAFNELLNVDVNKPLEDVIESEASFFERARYNAISYNTVAKMAPFIFNSLNFEQNHVLNSIKDMKIGGKKEKITLAKTMKIIAKDSARVEWRILDKQSYSKGDSTDSIEARIIFRSKSYIFKFQFAIQLQKSVKDFRLYSFIVNEKNYPTKYAITILALRKIDFTLFKPNEQKKNKLKKKLRKIKKKEEVYLMHPLFYPEYKEAENVALQQHTFN